MTNAIGLAIDTSDNLYVSSAGSNEIYKYDSSETLLWSATTGLNSGPRGLTIDQSGNVYLANYLGQNILKYDSAGNLISTINVGTGNPYDVKLDASGNLYNSLFNGGKVDKYDGETVDSSITGLGQPTGLLFDSSGDLFVADYQQKKINKFDSGGSFLYSWSTGINNQPRFMALASSNSPPPTMSSVPEPSTLILGGIATCMLIFASRRKRKLPEANQS